MTQSEKNLSTFQTRVRQMILRFQEVKKENKDLYAMAKNAAALEKYRHKHDDREDERISAENERARERAAEPKDYSVKETPMPQTEVQMDISFDGEVPQVTAVGVGMISE